MCFSEFPLPNRQKETRGRFPGYFGGNLQHAHIVTKVMICFSDARVYTHDTQDSVYLRCLSQKGKRPQARTRFHDHAHSATLEDFNYVHRNSAQQDSVLLISHIICRDSLFWYKYSIRDSLLWTVSPHNCRAQFSVINK